MQSQVQTSNVFLATPPAAIINTASAVHNVIDTLGYDHLRILCALGATDIALTALKVTESDVKASGTTLTSGVDVTGLIYGTSNDITGTLSVLPSATDDNKVFAFDVDLRARKRYMIVTATFGTGSTGGYVTILAVLSRAEQDPITAAGQGVANVLAV